MNASFVLFSPDATTTGLYHEAVRIFRQNEIFFHFWRWLRLTPRHTQSLYADKRSEGVSAFDGLVDELFSLDWCLAGLAWSPLHHDIWLSVNNLKGPSDPHRQTSKHIRRQLGAENKLMNFLHSSDSQEATVREFEVVVGGEALASEHRRELTTPPEPVDLRRRTSIRLVDTCTRIKERVPQISRVLGRLVEDEQLCDSAGLGVAESRARVLRKQRSALRAAGEQDVLKRLHPLFSPDYLSVDVEAMLSSMGLFGLEVDDWDALILRCNATD